MRSSTASTDGGATALGSDNPLFQPGYPHYPLGERPDIGDHRHPSRWSHELACSHRCPIEVTSSISTGAIFTGPIFTGAIFTGPIFTGSTITR
jgi:hypothetical protein